MDTAILEAQSAQQTRAEPRLYEGDRIVFAGELSRPRHEWVREITVAGLDTGGLTKTTKMIVAADPDPLSGKAEKARGYGIPIVTEVAFRKHLEAYLRR